jgi:hypothetical protein
MVVKLWHGGGWGGSGAWIKIGEFLGKNLKFFYKKRGRGVFRLRWVAGDGWQWMEIDTNR